MIRVIQPAHSGEWDRYISNTKSSTVFHTSQWSRVIERTYGYIPRYFVLTDGNNEIKAALPLFEIKNLLGGKRLVCLPFSDFCSPLYTRPEDFLAIWDSVLAFAAASSVTRIEIRGDIPIPVERHDYFRDFNLSIEGNLDKLWSGFKEKSIRYSIRKAEKNGIGIESGYTLDAVRAFFRLNCLTRKRHGVLPQPFNLFRKIHEEMIENGKGFLMLATQARKVIGASIFLVHGDVVYHKYNASDSRFRNLCANHYLLWKTILWVKESGYRILNLGRTSPDNFGLMAFKQHWGARESPLPYCYWPRIGGATSLKENTKSYRMLRSIIKRMPLFIDQFAATLLYKHLG